MSRLWEKGEPLDPRVLEYTVGDDPHLDTRLVPYDVRASIAHATMLCEQGHISASDLSMITGGLKELAGAHTRGAANPPSPDSISGRRVRLLAGPMRRISSAPASMSTPESR